MYKKLWISPWLPMNCVRLATERKMGDEWIEKLAPFTFTQGHPVTALCCLGPHNPLEGRDTTNQYFSVIAFILSWRKFGTASVHRTWGLTNGLMNMTFYSVTCPQSLKVLSPQQKQVLILRIVVTKYSFPGNDWCKVVTMVTECLGVGTIPKWMIMKAALRFNSQRERPCWINVTW